MRTVGCTILFCGVLAGSILAAQSKQSKPEVINQLPRFQCGDELRPGIPYEQLADCYEAERGAVRYLGDWYSTAAAEARKANDKLASQGSFTIEGTVYTDMKSLAGKYNDLINEYNANRKSWAAEEQECNAQEARQVVDYNNLVINYNSLLRIAKTPAYHPAYAPTQPQRIYCSTVYNNTSCWWQ